MSEKRYALIFFFSSAWYKIDDCLSLATQLPFQAEWKLKRGCTAVAV